MRSQYEKQGFVVVPGLLEETEALSLARLAERIATGADRTVAPHQVQVQYGKDGSRRLIKLAQLTRTHPAFEALAHHPPLVDVVERLIGPGARLFRDVIIGKPARTGGPLSLHQDSAYWDVEPMSLVSVWVALSQAPSDASCLEVIPGAHGVLQPHTLLLRNRWELPSPLTRGLRRLVSKAGTGDNPGNAGGHPALWRLKSAVLSGASRLLPVLGDLQDYRLRPGALAGARPVALPIRAGDAVFFHSLLPHATGPNLSANDRWADVISYMPADARVSAGAATEFPSARRAA